MPDDSETILSLFCSQVARTPGRTAMYVRGGVEFRPISWAEVSDDVRRTAAALVGLGVRPGDRVILVSPNRYEWVVCDLAIQMAQAIHVPVHASLSGHQIAHQIIDSGAAVVILSGEEQAEKLIPDAAGFSAQLKVVAFDPCPDAWDHFHFERWSELITQVSDADATKVENDALSNVGPQHLATILYTSGTTGEPKGVMLSQQNLSSNALASLAAFSHEEDDVRLTWLPLSHIFARTCDLYTWIAAGCALALADSPEAVISNCSQLHPTLLNGVPYFFEKVQRKLLEFEAAPRAGRLVEIFGGRLRSCISGGAPLPEYVARFYHEQGIKLLQGYGMTESSPVITTETESDHKLGTVGRPIDGVEIRVTAEGEIQTRGPHVMMGYWHNVAATSETIRDGWLSTGDLGEIDADGFLKITGRKKELIVTAGGKNIAPAHLEALLIEDPLIQQALVIGDRRNYLTALIVPDQSALAAALKSERITPSSPSEVLEDSRVRRLFQQRIDQRLEIVSRYEQVRNFILLDRPFSVEHGELTPTLKLRRGVIQESHAEAIQAMYDAGRDTAMA